MSSKIDGSKYFYWRNRYISTGNLRAFDLMTRHYAADPSLATPVGKRSRISVNPVQELIKGIAIINRVIDAKY